MLLGCACWGERKGDFLFAPRVTVFFNVTCNGHIQTVPTLLSELGIQCVFASEARCWCVVFSFSNTDCIGDLKWHLVVKGFSWWSWIWLLTLILYFAKGDSTVVGTSRLRDLYDKFEEELGNRQEKAKAARPPWEPPKTKLDEDLGEWESSRPLLVVFLTRLLSRMQEILFYKAG